MTDRNKTVAINDLISPWDKELSWLHHYRVYCARRVDKTWIKIFKNHQHHEKVASTSNNIRKRNRRNDTQSRRESRREKCPVKKNVVSGKRMEPIHLKVKRNTTEKRKTQRAKELETSRQPNRGLEKIEEDWIATKKKNHRKLWLCSFKWSHQMPTEEVSGIL